MIKCISLSAKLHNFVMQMKDEWIEDNDIIKFDPPNEVPTRRQPSSHCVTTIVGVELLDTVMKIALNFHWRRRYSFCLIFESPMSVVEDLESQHFKHLLLFHMKLETFSSKQRKCTCFGKLVL